MSERRLPTMAELYQAGTLCGYCHAEYERQRRAERMQEARTAGMKLREISERFGVSKATVCRSTSAADKPLTPAYLARKRREMTRR